MVDLLFKLILLYAYSPKCNEAEMVPGDGRWGRAQVARSCHGALYSPCWWRTHISYTTTRLTEPSLLFQCHTVSLVCFWQFFKSYNNLNPPTLMFFFFFGFLKFIYLFRLRWVFVAVRGLAPVAVSGCHSSPWCTGILSRWLLLLRSTGSRRTDFSSCGTWAQ